jgi:hypothetical protein
MRRREFITLMGGAATIWPLAARAQQRERMRRIGVLESYNESDPQQRLLTAAFVGGLQKLGWIAGTNVAIDYRWGGGDPDRIRHCAAELTDLQPDVILSAGPLPLLALKRALGKLCSTVRSTDAVDEPPRAMISGVCVRLAAAAFRGVLCESTRCHFFAYCNLRRATPLEPYKRL